MATLGLNSIKFELFFLNALFLSFNILFFSNKWFQYKITAYNWHFLKHYSSNFSIEFFFNYKELFKMYPKVFRILNYLKKYFYYIVDTLYNFKNLCLLWKINKFTIGSPYNFASYSLLFYPLISFSKILISNIIVIIDIFFFNLILFLQKKQKYLNLVI